MRPKPTFIGRDRLDKSHRQSLRLFGGTEGIRDEGLIESALASAQNTYFYGGDDYDIAAAYAFHIAQAQAFLDGNKRTAIAVAIIFLAANGYGYKQDDGRLFEAMIGIAEKRIGKRELAAIFREVYPKRN